MNLRRLITQSTYRDRIDKGRLLVAIGEASENEIEEIFKEVENLVDYKIKTSGMFARRENPQRLLLEF